MNRSRGHGARPSLGRNVLGSIPFRREKPMMRRIQAFYRRLPSTQLAIAGVLVAAAVVMVFVAAQYVASGRVTAMALAPTCTHSKCTLYVAAAGGGVWRTDKALTGSNWQFISGSFGTNAIGSLLMDPNDPSGNTIYAGTGEP